MIKQHKALFQMYAQNFLHLKCKKGLKVLEALLAGYSLTELGHSFSNLLQPLNIKSLILPFVPTDING